MKRFPFLILVLTFFFLFFRLPKEVIAIQDMEGPAVMALQAMGNIRLIQVGITTDKN